MQSERLESIGVGGENGIEIRQVDVSTLREGELGKLATGERDRPRSDDMREVLKD
jgi:hypothetical protein